MPRLLPGGITGRLIIYLALIGVLPPLAVGMSAYSVSQSTVRNEALRYNKQLLQAQSDFLEAQVEQVQELIGNVLGVEAITSVVGQRDSESDAYSQLATQARIGYLLNAYMAVRGLVSIDIFTVDGRHYHVGDTLDVQSIDENQRDALFEAVSTDPEETLWIGAETNVNGKSRVPQVIAAARAIEAFEPDGRSRVAGLLLVSQDSSYFHSAIRRLEGDMLGGLLLIDGRNRIIYQRDAKVFGTKLAPATLAGLASVHGSTQRMINGVDMLVSEVTSSMTGWRLFSLVPLQELDARSSPIWQTTTMAILACLLVIALTTLSFSRAVVMPLRRIRQAFQDLQRSGSASMRPLPITGRDEVGELTGWFNAFLESSGARERSERALREAETRLRLMHEASFTGLCVHHEGVVLEANQALCREFGRSYADLIGTRLSGLLAPDTPAATLFSLERHETSALDVEAVRADGSRFPAEVSSRAIPFRGVDAYVVDIRNIEARKRTEAELERLKNQAEVASQAKSQFLATMSHEIRTPMNAVLGLAQLLEECSLGAVEREMVHKIRSAGQLLLGIINDILDFSKIEAGRTELACEPFKLCDVLDNVAGIMAAAADAKEIELVIGPVASDATFLRGDALRLEQVLVNLVGNAIKFTEAGCVSLTSATSSLRPGKVGVRFVVQDTGIGIAPEQLENIFGAFSQAEGSTTRRFGGTGLGLAISRRLVTMMGGSIGVTSTPGVGSEFRVDVPFLLDQKAPRLARATGEPGASELPDRLHVLIADDHPVALATLTDLARSLGWSVVGCSSGDQAVERAVSAAHAGRPFDAVVMDWKMPGMDGRVAAGRIRAALRHDRSPAIVLMATQAGLPKSTAGGVVDEVLSKPVTASALRDAVGRNRSSRADRPDGRPEARRRRRLTHCSILVVDDSEINREVARLILEGEGARVLLAGNGNQALAILEQAARDVHIVLMDIRMPGMTGFEATRQIRKRLRLTELTVVALTADVQEGHQAATADAGMNGFVAKPFNVDHLIATIVRLTEPAPAAATDPISPAPAAIDAAQQLRKGKDAAVSEHALRRFVEAHGGDAQVILRLLDQGMRAEAAAALDRLRGATGSMALTTVSQSADETYRALERGDDPAAALSRLKNALAAASLEIAARPGDDGDLTSAQVCDTTAADLRGSAEAALDRLAGSLSADQAAPSRGQLDHFGVPTAKLAARATAAHCSIGFPDPNDAVAHRVYHDARSPSSAHPRQAGRA